MPIDIIMQSAGCTQESTFGKYYHKPAVARENFGTFLFNKGKRTIA